MTFDLTHVTQLLHGELAPATVATAETGHFLFTLRVGAVPPRELSTGLHHPEGDRNPPVLPSSPSSPSSSSSPAGEKGHDGEAGVVTVGEDVLGEEVGLAAVLWVTGQRSMVTLLTRGWSSW